MSGIISLTASLPTAAMVPLLFHVSKSKLSARRLHHLEEELTSPPRSRRSLPSAKRQVQSTENNRAQDRLRQPSVPRRDHRHLRDHRHRRADPRSWPGSGRTSGPPDTGTDDLNAEAPVVSTPLSDALHRLSAALVPRTSYLPLLSQQPSCSGSKSMSLKPNSALV